MQSNGATQQFTIGGARVSLNRKLVENALRNVRRDPIKKYKVRIASTEDRIKQVISVAAAGPLLASISTVASRRLRNQCSFKHSSRILPLKLSMNAFWTGFPGSMKCSFTPRS